MKITSTYKLFSVTLSVLVLFSTLSFTVEKHYCGDHLVDTAIFTEAKKCGGMDAEAIDYIKKPCCQDKIEIVKGQDELNKADYQELEQTYKYTLVAYLHSIIELYESQPKLTIPHKHYLPPKLIKDIQVLDETFLI